MALTIALQEQTSPHVAHDMYCSTVSAVHAATHFPLRRKPAPLPARQSEGQKWPLVLTFPVLAALAWKQRP